MKSAWPMVLFALLSGAARSEEPPAPSSTVLAQRLTDLDQRDASFCELRQRAKDPALQTFPCGPINHVVVAPQRDGPPMYVVFTRETRISPQARIGKAEGPFTLVAGDGALIPPFGNANMLDPGDRVFSYAGDERLAIGQQTLASSQKNHHVRWFNITPITPAQQPLLALALKPGRVIRSEPAPWTWSVVQGRDGEPGIELAQNDADGLPGAPVARYSYRRDTDAYDGPRGGGDAPFLRLPQDREAAWKALTAFADAPAHAKPTATTGKRPTPHGIVPCQPGTSQHKQASDALAKFGQQVRALEATSAVEPANRALAALLELPCFALAQENPRTVIAPGPLSLRRWWLDGGAVWLHGYLTLAQDLADGFAWGLLPPDLRPEHASADASAASVLRCDGEPGCGQETEGWRVRAEHVRPTDEFDGKHQPKRPRPEDCEKLANGSPGAYSRWRTCIEPTRERSLALPLEGWRAPSRGWLVVEGRRGHHAFCDQVSVFDLTGGAACVIKRCASRFEGSQTEELTGTPSDSVDSSVCGHVQVDNLREALWMAALVKDLQLAQVGLDGVRIPKGLAVEWFRRGETGQGGGSYSVSDGQTSLRWRWLDEGKTLGAGTLTWPSSYEASETHATQLLRIAESGFVEGPLALDVPAWLFSRKAEAPHVSHLDANGDEFDQRFLELEAELLELAKRSRKP